MLKITKVITTILIVIILVSCTAFEYGTANKYKNKMIPVNSLNGKLDNKIGEYLLGLEERHDPKIKKYIKEFGKPDYIYRKGNFITYFIYLTPQKSICFTKKPISFDSKNPRGTTITRTDSFSVEIQSEIISFYSMHDASEVKIKKDDGNYKWFISLYSEVNLKYKNGTGFDDGILQSNLKKSNNNISINLKKWANFWSTKGESVIIPEAESYIKQKVKVVATNNVLLKKQIKSLMINFINKNWEKINSSFPINKQNKKKNNYEKVHKYLLY